MSIGHARIVSTRSTVSYRPCWTYKNALWSERRVSHLRFANHLYHNDMATSCRRKACKSSIPNAWPYILFIRRRVRNRNPISQNWRDHRSCLAFISLVTDMDALLGRLAIADLRFVRELEVLYLYTVVAVDCILIGPRHCFIVTVGMLMHHTCRCCCQRMLLERRRN